MSEVVTTAEELGRSYRPPSQGVLDKQLLRLDRQCRQLIAQSPIVLLATAGADGSCDVSFHNVLENPHAGAEFFGEHMSGMGTDAAAEMLETSYRHRL